MAVENLFIEIHAGTKVSLDFEITDQTSLVVPQPLKDMSGKRWLFLLTTMDEDGLPDFTASVLRKDSDTVGDWDLTDASDGVGLALIVSADTTALMGLYHFQCEAIDIDSEPVMLASGTLSIKGNIIND